MAQASPAAGIDPGTRRTADHTTQRGRISLFTSGLPRPLAASHRARRRRLWRQGARSRGGGGRSIPYAGSAPGAEVSLVAGVVGSALGALLVATLGGTAALAPRLLATAARPVEVPPVAAAADRERPLAAQAVAQVKDGNPVRRQSGLLCPGSGQPGTACARLRRSLWPRLSSEGPRNNRKAPAPEPGFSFSGASGSASLSHLPFSPAPLYSPGPPSSSPHLHPPRYTRGMMISL